ncbi:MAG: divalent-cation tolerance protein CutA [Magnetococcus sp. DMHC-6]
MDKNSAIVIVWSNAPDQATAHALAETLVLEGVAACVHVFGQGHSFYLWEGTLNRSAEWTLMIKTTRSGQQLLIDRLLALHPYEMPEVLITSVDGGYPPYLTWVHQSCRTELTKE